MEVGEFEPALFAFVQHLSFIWNQDALFVGSKKINNMSRAVWYKPLRPGDSIGDSLWLDQRGSFNGDKIHKCTIRSNEPLVDYFWPSFTTAFGLSKGQCDPRYISGVHTILLTFPKLRKSCSEYEIRAWAEGRLTTATDHIPLRKYELPFLPESVWMSTPIGSQRPEPITPSEGSRSRPGAQTISITGRRSSIKEIERIQNIIQGQRRQLKGTGERQNRGKPHFKRHSVLESIERSSETCETNEITSEANTEVYRNATSESDGRLTPVDFSEYIDLTAVDHVNRLLQQNNVEVAFGTAERIAGTAHANVQLTVTFPTRIRQQQTQPTLQLSSITSIDLPPILPSRRAALELLCALAMETATSDNQR